MKQIEIASKYLGQKEKKGNDFDEDTPLGKILKAAGHIDGQAWCAYFAVSIFVETLRAFFSASTVQTFHNFKNAGYEISDIPKVGYLVIWQTYKQGVAQWSGHCGIVTKVVDETTFVSIEGNTAESGGREGNSVQEKVRTTTRTENGLNVLGFIKIF